MTQNGVTGHAITVTAFEELIVQLESLKQDYRASKEELKVEKLKIRLEKAKEVMATYDALISSYRNLINERQEAAEKISAILPRIKSAFISCTPSQASLDDLMSFIKKFRGQRLTKKSLAGDFESEQKLRSHVQTSYVDRMAHFNGLIAFLSTQSVYKTEVVELTINGLKALAEQNESYNNKVYEALAKLNRIREERNTLLYGEDSIYSVSVIIKNLIRSQLGNAHPFTKKIIAIKITKRKK